MGFRENPKEMEEGREKWRGSERNGMRTREPECNRKKTTGSRKRSKRADTKKGALKRLRSLIAADSYPSGDPVVKPICLGQCLFLNVVASGFSGTDQIENTLADVAFETFGFLFKNIF
jgi:hypothetical protein